MSLAADDFPDARWFKLMLGSQLRGAVGAAAIQLRDKSPSWLRARMDRWTDAGLRLVEDQAPGGIAGTGDAELAYLRFAGTNPFSIRRVQRLDELTAALRLDDALLARLLGPGTTLDERLARGDLFVASFDEVSTYSRDDLQADRYVAPVRALFCHAPEMTAPYPVVPLAIERPAGTPRSTAHVFTPLDAERWVRAKQLLGVADVNVSELCVHLARAHFMTVPFALALRRAFNHEHPLYRFLLPHLRFNLFVDRMAWLQGLRTKSGALVRSLAGTPAWCQRVAKSVHASHSFREQHFERDLEARGLSKPTFDYPYRDDGRLLWAALRRFAGSYMRVVYADDDAVLADAELQRFVADLVDVRSGNVRGLLAGERLDSRDELAEILTQVMFVAGPLHALAHYGSAAQLQRVDSQPSWLTADPFSHVGDVSPGEVRGLAQYHRVASTNLRYDRLGDFSRHPLHADARRHACFAELQAELEAAEQTIRARNEQRFAPFVHFLPSRISNGITV